jgi:hypothetical protein
MSGFTLSGGLAFSGGFTITEAPVLPPENTAAWFAGGAYGYGSTSVDRITFATDTATASVRGPLSSETYFLAAASNTTYAWFGGGSGGYPGPVSTVQRITYATDTAAPSVRGPLSSARYALGAAGNTTDGWFGGGKLGGPSYAVISTVDRITYATDTATASVRGPLSLAITSLAAVGNTTDGWFGGGYLSPTLRTTVNRITYATDTATASVRGPLSVAVRQLAAAGNNDYGWFGDGKLGAPSNAPRSTVDRITYATDTATASVRGPLSSARYGLGAAGNTTDGWFGGGGPSNVSTVDRITYATDTATASVRGPLSLGRLGLAAAGGIQ